MTHHGNVPFACRITPVALSLSQGSEMNEQVARQVVLVRAIETRRYRPRDAERRRPQVRQPQRARAGAWQAADSKAAATAGPFSAAALGADPQAPVRTHAGLRRLPRARPAACRRWPCRWCSLCSPGRARPHRRSAPGRPAVRAAAGHHRLEPAGLPGPAGLAVDPGPQDRLGRRRGCCAACASASAALPRKLPPGTVRRH